MRSALPLLLFSSLALASVKLETRVQFRGNEYRPSLVLEEGKWVEITQDQLRLRVRATPVEKLGVKIETEVYEDKKLLGKPSIATRWGSPAVLSVENDDGSARFGLAVLPSRQ